MKRHLLLPIAALCAIAGAASAQETAMPPSTGPAAISNPNDTAKTIAAPVAGKNSFTQSQAKSRLEKHGYTQVSGLMQDENSVWHATAMKNGQSVNVALDYQGNISEQ